MGGHAVRDDGVCNDALVSASEALLKQIAELYEIGIASPCAPGGTPLGALGLLSIAAALGLGKTIRKPRKKISVMIVGNHSAGKSSFINWYIGERVVKTGVAIETRGFIFCTSGRRRETLTGDATVRYFDHLSGFGDSFQGLLPNLFTEVVPSRERAFACVDLIDTPGLVDGDMKYPFNVKDCILWLADHVDLILVFLDPIGQATCHRTLEVVEQLNRTAHVEKIHYFMSKADEVGDERDRQRVLTQITWNLAPRVRNSHAFNLPTLYLPHDDDGGLPCSIPNAIQDVCSEVDKAIRQTVQRTLKQLKADCAILQDAVMQRRLQDTANRATNVRRTALALALAAAAAAVAAALLAAGVARGAGALCSWSSISGGGAGSWPSGGSNGNSNSGGIVCGSGPALTLRRWHAALSPLPPAAAAAAVAVLVALMLSARIAWRGAPVLSKRGLRRLDEMAVVVSRMAARAELLYEEYFLGLALDAGER